jgi:molybdopterin molybdotransferase
MSELLNVDQALAEILSRVGLLGAERIALAQATGRVLAQAVIAPESIPPFANSSMDGYAVRAVDVVSASRENPARLTVGMDVPAGSFPDRALQPGQAARIMTGAPIPAGADAVIPVEETDGAWEAAAATPPVVSVQIFASARAGANVRPIGEDITRGQTVLTAGTALRAQEIGVLAAVGQAQVAVIRRPRAAILTTGDELLAVDQPLAPGKIRDANSYTLAARVAELGGEALRLPIARDTLDEVRGMFRSALAQQPDLIISSAGVSVGAADLIRTVLAELGEVGFWRINLRPGKPLAFGQVGGVPFFGLPGNPVSAMITFDVLVRPALLKMAGRADEWPLAEATTTEAIHSDGRRSYIRVKLKQENGSLYATTTGTQSSGALMSMVTADGLLIIPEGVKHVPAGATLAVRLLR